MRKEINTGDEMAKNNLCELFRALSEPNRLRIVLLLMEGEQNIKSISEKLKLKPVTTSQCVNLLKMYRVIQSRRDGTYVYYALAYGITAANGAISFAMSPLNHIVVIAPQEAE